MDRCPAAILYKNDAAAAAALDDAHLDGDALDHGRHVRDHPDLAAMSVQRLQRTDRHVERVAVERAEAFVDEERVDEGLAALEPG